MSSKKLGISTIQAADMTGTYTVVMTAENFVIIIIPLSIKKSDVTQWSGWYQGITLKEL